MKLEACHADTCLSCYWGGHHLPHIQAPVHYSMTLAELKTALINELRTGCVMGSRAPEEDNSKWFEAAEAAVNELRALDVLGDQTPLFLNLVPDGDENDESVYVFFVFVESN